MESLVLGIDRSCAIPRCLKERHSLAAQTSVHTFTDAWEAAYAASVYIRHEYGDGSVTKCLIGLITRLSPLKATIPRLELMGPAIGLRLTEQISSALDFPMSQMNVICWIHGQSRNYKHFVSYRVWEIHGESNPRQWHHVPTKQNPVDLRKRELSVSELAN